MVRGAGRRLPGLAAARRPRLRLRSDVRADRPRYHLRRDGPRREAPDEPPRRRLPEAGREVAVTLAPPLQRRDWGAAAQVSRDSPTPRPSPEREGGLALYIHWPFCVSKCPYCDFNSHVRESVDQAQWRDALLADMSW